MKNVMWLTFLLMCACSDTKQKTTNEVDCASFRTGKFVYIMEGDTTLFSAERDETYQKENEPGTSNISTYKIDWVDACSYDLILEEKYIASSDTTVKEKEGIKVRINMLEIKGDSMVFEVRIPGMDNGLKGSMKKIN